MQAQAEPAGTATDLLRQLLRPHRAVVLLIALPGIFSVPLLIAQMWYLAKIAAALLAKSPFAGTDVFLLALCWFGRTALLLAKDDIAQHLSRKLRCQVRQHLLAQLAALGPLRSRFGSDGALSTLLTEQVDALDGYISRYAPQQILVLAAPLFILVAVAFHSIFAALLLLLTAPLVPLFMVLVGREASKASQQQLQLLSRMGGRLYDFLQGLPLLKRLNATDIAAAHLEHAAGQYQQGSMKVLRLAFLSTAVLELFSSVAIALVALYLGLGLLGELPWHKAQLLLPYQSALFILLLCPEFYQPLRQLGTDYHARAQAIAACAEFRALYQAEHNSPQKAATQVSLVTCPVQAAELNFHHILVGDVSAPRLRINELSIKAGEQLLLSGPSGSGKSTFLQLIAGFVPFSGEVKVDGIRLNSSSIYQLRNQIGYLQQQAELLPGTIADNLKLAKSDATGEEMQQVLTQVELWDFLSRQPEGLDYRIGDFGAGLSGGQQQRLALARLLLQQKPIWLLDEPFAELDEDTSLRLSALLQRISQGKTLLLVSHQFSQLGWLNRTLRFEQGQLVFTDDLSKNNKDNTTLAASGQNNPTGVADA